MDPDRARKLLAGERERIERTLAGLVHQDTGEPADEEDAYAAAGVPRTSSTSVADSLAAAAAARSRLVR